MKTYIYDRSFDGLATVIDILFENDTPESEFEICDEETPALFSENIHIDTDPKRAERVLSFLRANTDDRGFRRVLTAFLSRLPQIDLSIYRVLMLMRKIGNKALSNMADPDVIKVVKSGKRVAFEAHRFNGLIRFRELTDGVLYAPIEPDFDILPLIAQHFAKRYSKQKWVIHDTNRKSAVLFDGNTCREVIIEEAPDIKGDTTNQLVDPEEAYYQSLWKTFYKSIVIKERRNLKLQQSYIPKKYRKYLVEFEKDIK